MLFDADFRRNLAKKHRLNIQNSHNPMKPLISFSSTFLLIITHCIISLTIAPLQAQPPGVQYRGEGRAADDAPAMVYKQRRERVLATMSNRTVAVFLAADVRNRQNDVDYEYRQSSDLLYLSGFNEPKSALVLVPSGYVDSVSGQRLTEILFVQKRNPSQELWTGVTSGTDGAEKEFGIKALDYARFSAVLAQIMATRDTLYITTLPTAQVTETLSGESVSLDAAMKQRLTTKNPNLIIRSQKKLLSEMRQMKDTAELRLLQKAIDISVAGHLATMKYTRAGMREYECEALMESTFKQLGAEDVGYASIVGSGANACILHYIANRRQIKDGELLLMDCGAEYHGYTADITRTIPINGKYSAEQKAIYDLVYQAQNASIAECKKGVDWRFPHSRAVDVIRKGLLALGIITNPDDYKWYFPHGSSHHIGLDVHDASTYSALQPGMVLTVEPGIYIPEGSPCDKKWWNIGIRIEDDVLVTDGDALILSAKLPRKAEDIEAAIQSVKR